MSRAEIFDNTTWVPDEFSKEACIDRARKFREIAESIERSIQITKPKIPNFARFQNDFKHRGRK